MASSIDRHHGTGERHERRQLGRGCVGRSSHTSTAEPLRDMRDAAGAAKIKNIVDAPGPDEGEGNWSRSGAAPKHVWPRTQCGKRSREVNSMRPASPWMAPRERGGALPTLKARHEAARAFAGGYVATIDRPATVRTTMPSSPHLTDLLTTLVNVPSKRPRSRIADIVPRGCARGGAKSKAAKHVVWRGPQRGVRWSGSRGISTPCPTGNAVARLDAQLYESGPPTGSGHAVISRWSRRDPGHCVRSRGRFYEAKRARRTRAAARLDESRAARSGSRAARATISRSRGCNGVMNANFASRARAPQRARGRAVIASSARRVLVRCEVPVVPTVHGVDTETCK